MNTDHPHYDSNTETFFTYGARLDVDIRLILPHWGFPIIEKVEDTLNKLLGIPTEFIFYMVKESEESNVWYMASVNLISGHMCVGINMNTTADTSYEAYVLIQLYLLEYDVRSGEPLYEMYMNRVKKYTLYAKQTRIHVKNCKQRIAQLNKLIGK